MNRDEARELLAQTLLDIVPDADVAALPDDADFRDALELDSLDFVELVERLSKRSGVRIDEDDYRSLRTIGDASAFLASHAAAAPAAG
jgi:acyl carrier protein